MSVNHRFTKSIFRVAVSLLAVGATAAPSFAGGWLGKAGGAISGKAHQTGRALSGTAKKVGGSVSGAAKNAGGTVSGEVHRTGGTVAAAARQTGGTVAKAAQTHILASRDFITNGVKNVENSIGKTVNQMQGKGSGMASKPPASAPSSNSPATNSFPPTQAGTIAISTNPTPINVGASTWKPTGGTGVVPVQSPPNTTAGVLTVGNSSSPSGAWKPSGNGGGTVYTNNSGSNGGPAVLVGDMIVGIMDALSPASQGFGLR